MTGEKWQSAWQIYSAVREMPLSERQSFFDSASSDPEIISEVLLLLEQSERHAPEPVTRHTIHAVGSQVSRYVLLSELGRGGMGQVFSARDTELGRNVALKFLNFETAIHSEAAQKLLREAQIASALNHLNIVTIHEVIRSETSIAIVMELVEGQSLRQMCKKRLPIEEVIPIGRQIAGALATAHAQGIVHRDIKPENMIVRPDGCVKVLDFGLARQRSNVSELSNASLPAGTLRYMSPEQTRGEAATSASDVFSFGLVLYELLAGQHAFPGKTPVETAHAILMREPTGELPHDVPVELGRLTMSMLAKDASKRPHAGQVAAQLDKILAARGAPEIRTGRRRWWIPTLAAGVAIAAAGVWLTQRRPSADDLTDLTIRPLTSQSGRELAPALSPDGNAIAFTWTATLDRRPQIYVKRGNDNEPFTVTASQAGQIGFLTWSPDAKRIAFKRHSPASASSSRAFWPIVTNIFGAYLAKIVS
jgi:serine/threonine protein kinase